MTFKKPRHNIDFSDLDTHLAETAKITLTPEEMTALFGDPVKKQRARDAYYNGNVAATPRRERANAPVYQFCYIKPTSTEHLRDSRLSPGARVALQIIIGLLGNRKRHEISVGGIARALDVTKRTARRYLAVLERHGYITRQVIRNIYGWITAGVIELLHDVRPHYVRHKTKKSEKTSKNRRNQERTKKTSINPQDTTYLSETPLGTTLKQKLY